MTDKFEFKKEGSLNGSQQIIKFRTKPSLHEYKQVIMELSQALSQATTENDQLKSQLNAFKQRYALLEKDCSIERAKNTEISQKDKWLKEDTTRLNSILQTCRNEIAEKEKKIQELLHSKAEMEEKSRLQNQKIVNLEKLNLMNTEKIRILSESLQRMSEENKLMRVEAESANQLNQQQMYELKNFTQEIKKKFEVLETTPVKYSYYPEETNRLEDKIFDFKQKRAVSTQKKRRNIGCLSNSNLHRRPTRNNQDHHYIDQLRPFDSSSINPELGNELQSLKKELAHQYTLINMRNETYSKERVSKALDLLKRKMGRVVEAAQQSQGESFQY